MEHKLSEIEEAVLDLERRISHTLHLVRSNQKTRFSGEGPLLEMHRLAVELAVALDTPCPEE